MEPVLDLAGFRPVAQILAQKNNYLDAGFLKTPDAARLLMHHDSKRLWIWQVLGSDQQSLGYVGIAWYSGPPFVFPISTASDVSTEVVLVCVLKAAESFFRLTQENMLLVFVPLVQQQIYEPFLTEMGFDWEPDYPGADRNEETTFIMRRHTFETYYGA